MLHYPAAFQLVHDVDPGKPLANATALAAETLAPLLEDPVVHRLEVTVVHPVPPSAEHTVTSLSDGLHNSVVPMRSAIKTYGLNAMQCLGDSKTQQAMLEAVPEMAQPYLARLTRAEIIPRSRSDRDNKRSMATIALYYHEDDERVLLDYRNRALEPVATAIGAEVEDLRAMAAGVPHVTIALIQMHRRRQQRRALGEHVVEQLNESLSPNCPLSVSVGRLLFSRL